MYLIVFLIWTLGLAIVCLPMLVRRSWAHAAIVVWIRGLMTFARTIVGITCRVEGLEHVPPGACIIAAQHQSSFETYRLFVDLAYPVFVLKKELTMIPFVGWYMGRAGLVAIDRAAGAAAMRHTLRSAQAALDRGHQVVIFPEGTRTPAGVVNAYKPGVAALYLHCKAPVIPLALNSGRLWGKTRILKRPGVITFRFLPALPSGLGRDDMLAELRRRIDAADAAIGP
jgi:1-acyl-sn-glycerol-3-phosphate acyltransferase